MKKSYIGLIILLLLQMFVLSACYTSEKTSEVSIQTPSVVPTVEVTPTEKPTEESTPTPVEKPTEKPSPTPVETPIEKPTEKPSPTPVETPTEKPTMKPSPTPVETPTEKTSPTPIQIPTEEPTPTTIETPITTPTSVPTQLSAADLLKQLTLEEKIGQLFIVRCPAGSAKEIAAEYQFGGYVLFARDFQNKTKEQVIADIAGYQSVSKIGMLIAVDEEGGTVNRVSKYKQFRDTPFLSPRDLYNKGGWELIISDTEEKCRLLKSLGINVNLAPVCDVSLNKNDYMYNRSFGISAEMTAEYIKNVVNVMVKNKMGSALKHFPGYGSNVDTHTGIAIDNRSIESFWKNDFIPFQAGIESGTGIVLVSHNIITALDAEHPASLSAEVHKLLREEMNFNGLIMTDALDMGAIKQYTNGEEAAVMAVIAGNDLICCTDYKTQYNAVLNAVKGGRISEERIDQSVLRILEYKLTNGLN